MEERLFGVRVSDEAGIVTKTKPVSGSKIESSGSDEEDSSSGAMEGTKVLSASGSTALAGHAGLASSIGSSLMLLKRQ